VTYKATLSGIDGCGKSTAIDNVSRDLAREGYTVAHANRPFFVETGCEKQYKFSSLVSFVDYLHRKADDAERRFAVTVINGLYQTTIRPLSEAYVKYRYNPDVIINGRDSNLDPTVYSTYYIPTLGKLSPLSRSMLFSFLIQTQRTDVIFYFDIDPAVAHERITKRIEKEKKAGVVNRKKFHHMHETPEGLKFLREQYEVSVDALGKKHNMNIVRINALSTEEDVSRDILYYVKNALVQTRSVPAIGII